MFVHGVEDTFIMDHVIVVFLGKKNKKQNTFTGRPEQIRRGERYLEASITLLVTIILPACGMLGWDDPSLSALHVYHHEEGAVWDRAIVGQERV